MKEFVKRNWYWFIRDGSRFHFWDHVWLLEIPLKYHKNFGALMRRVLAKYGDNMGEYILQNEQGKGWKLLDLDGL